MALDTMVAFKLTAFKPGHGSPALEIDTTGREAFYDFSAGILSLEDLRQLAAEIDSQLQMVEHHLEHEAHLVARDGESR